MKNNNIQKINSIGKGAKTVLLLVKVVVGICMVLVLLLGIAVQFLPDNAVTLDASGDARIVIDYEAAPYLRGAIRFDESDDRDIDFPDLKLESKVYHGIDSDTFSISAVVGELDLEDARLLLSLAAFLMALYLGSLFVAVIFAKKFAEALAVCESPFEANVIKRMKNLGFGLIPWAVLGGFSGCGIITGGASLLTTALVVLIVLLVAYIFAYGAQLQQESDELI